MILDHICVSKQPIKTKNHCKKITIINNSADILQLRTHKIINKLLKWKDHDLVHLQYT